jgi:hypothetical protein
MATGMMSRLAGKALSDFLKVGLQATGKVAEKGALNIMRGARTPGAVLGSTMQGPLPVGGQAVAGVARELAPLAVSGTALGLGALAGRLAQSPQVGYAQSGYALPVQKMGTPVAFANQQYVGGMSPMTNQAAAEAMLEQQKFQHQLQLIQARQSAASGQGSLPDVGMNEILGIASKIYA